MDLLRKVINEKYTSVLFENNDLSLETVMLLDRVQKNITISKELKSELEKLAQIDNRSFNNLVITILKNYVESTKEKK